MIAPPERMGRGTVVALVGLLLLVKAALVLGMADVFFWLEELEKGAAAKAMLDGLDVPHHQLAYHYYEGGGFVASHLAAVSYLLVGQNLLAHKLVAVGFQVAILLAGCRLAQSLFGARSGLWFGLLFIFGPEAYQKLGLINVGVHFEGCLFQLGVLGVGARILIGKDVRPRQYLLLGLVTGFGLFYSYQVAVAALWVLLLLLILRTRDLFGLGGLAGLLGTAVGAAPLSWMYAQVGEAVFDIHGTAVLRGQDGPSNSVLFREYLGSIFVEGEPAERMTPMTWSIFFLGAVAFAFRRRRTAPVPGQRSPRAGAFYLLGYLALFLAIYLSSGFVQGRAYYFFICLRLVPVWLMAALLVAGLLGQLTSHPLVAERRLGWILGSLLLGVGVHASLSALVGGRPERIVENVDELLHQKGYGYGRYLAKVLPHFEGDRARWVEILEGYDEPHPELLWADAAMNMYRGEFLAEVGGTPLEAYRRAVVELRELCGEDEARLAAFRLGLGRLLQEAHGWDRESLLQALDQVPDPDRALMLEAIGRVGGGSYATPELMRVEVERAGRFRDTQAYLQGLGRWAFFLHRRLGPEALFLEYPDPIAGPLRAGFEAERAWNRLP